MTEYSGKEDDVSMLNNDQLARAEALRIARAVLEVRGVGGSFLTPGSIQPGKAYDITSMANWIISGQFGLVAVEPTPAMDYPGSRPQETVVERTEPDDPEEDEEMDDPQCPHCNHLSHLPSPCDPGCFCHRTHAAEPGAPEVHFEIPEGERERLNASGRSASINIDDVKDTETRQAAPDPEDGWP